MIDAAYTFSPLTMDDVPAAARLTVDMWNGFRHEENPLFYQCEVESLICNLDNPDSKPSCYKLTDRNGKLHGVIAFTKNQENVIRIEAMDVLENNTAAQDALVQHFIVHGETLGAQKLAFNRESSTNAEANKAAQAHSHILEEILMRNRFTGPSLSNTFTYRY